MSQYPILALIIVQESYFHKTSKIAGLGLSRI